MAAAGALQSWLPGALSRANHIFPHFYHTLTLLKFCNLHTSHAPSPNGPMLCELAVAVLTQNLCICLCIGNKNANRVQSFPFTPPVYGSQPVMHLKIHEQILQKIIAEIAEGGAPTISLTDSGGQCVRSISFILFYLHLSPFTFAARKSFRSRDHGLCVPGPSFRFSFLLGCDISTRFQQNSRKYIIYLCVNFR